MRRISGLAVIVGTVAAFWDAAWLLANMPLSVGFGLIPVWQLVVIVGVSVMLLLLVALLWRLTR
jgi:hypothetical protein